MNRSADVQTGCLSCFVTRHLAYTATYYGSFCLLALHYTGTTFHTRVTAPKRFESLAGLTVVILDIPNMGVFLWDGLLCHMLQTHRPPPGSMAHLPQTIVPALAKPWNPPPPWVKVIT